MKEKRKVIEDDCGGKMKEIQFVVLAVWGGKFHKDGWISVKSCQIMEGFEILWEAHL